MQPLRMYLRLSQHFVTSSFGELPQSEVCRISIPHPSMNKGERNSGVRATQGKKSPENANVLRACDTKVCVARIRLRVGVARQEDVGTVVVVRHPIGGSVAGGVSRNATPRLRVPAVEAYVPAHFVVHHGIVGGDPHMGAGCHGAWTYVSQRRDPNRLIGVLTKVVHAVAVGVRASSREPRVVVWTEGYTFRLARYYVVDHPATVDRTVEIHPNPSPLLVYHVLRDRDVTIRGGHAHRVARCREREVVVGVREGQPPAGRIHCHDLEVVAHRPALV